MKNETPPDFSTKAHLLPHINKEGIKFGLISLILPVIALVLCVIFSCNRMPVASAISGMAAIPFLLLSYGVFLFFRDPERYPPDNENAILSPADGKICLIQEVPLPEELGINDGKKYWRVSVFMSVLNIHVNRMPLTAEIVDKKYVPGKFFNASLDKASKDNERCIYLMRTPAGVEFTVVQIAGLVAKRIVPFVEKGDKLQQTERFGLIRFGSRLDVYLPEGVMPKVSIGQIMVAGETILGEIPVA